MWYFFRLTFYQLFRKYLSILNLLWSSWSTLIILTKYYFLWYFGFKQHWETKFYLFPTKTCVSPEEFFELFMFFYLHENILWFSIYTWMYFNFLMFYNSLAGHIRVEVVCCEFYWNLLLSGSFPDSSLLAEFWVETVSETRPPLHQHPPTPPTSNGRSNREW